jgi:hypothetical protein
MFALAVVGGLFAILFDNRIKILAIIIESEQIVKKKD